MLKLMRMISWLLISMVTSSLAMAQNQNTESDDLDLIQVELNKTPTPQKKAPRESDIKQATEVVEEIKKDNTLKDFKGLGALAPFQEISVIQRKFLPKTGRFQLYGGLTAITNDPFFNTYGGAFKAGYFFNETWGLELNYFALSTTESQAATELKNNNNVKADSLAYSKSYLGGDLMYAPIYGKISWFNEKIVPFDMYFSLGYGTTAVSTNQNAGTLHLATGQIFALSKSVAFRWDFSWNFFNAQVVDQNSKTSSSSLNNLFLTVGMSWFFPEASYR